jgi:hypothetical protein
MQEVGRPQVLLALWPSGKMHLCHGPSSPRRLRPFCTFCSEPRPHSSPHHGTPISDQPILYLGYVPNFPCTILTRRLKFCSPWKGLCLCNAASSLKYLQATINYRTSDPLFFKWENWIFVTKFNMLFSSEGSCQKEVKTILLGTNKFKM